VLVLRRRPSSQIEIYFWLLIIAVCIAVEAVNGGSLPGLIIFILLIVALETSVQVRVSLRLTPDQVRVSVPLSRVQAVPRGAVGSIHMYFYFLSFHSAAGRRILRTTPYWTKGQLLELSEQLGVPLFRHKNRWLGLGPPAYWGTQVTRGHRRA
jgi:hypothetical protein